MQAGELDALAQSREQFLSFVRRRIADPELAEDVLQSSLTKAVQRFGGLEDRERLVPWFYAILRNAITDEYRARGRALEVELPDDLDVEDEAELERQACECFRSLLPALKPEYAEVIDALDLRNEPASALAERLDVSPNNLKVRHHRARQALRRRLEETCRVCAEHHCLDCTCEAAPGLS
jgi:RNA polymerase sigma factor (sigma-70 family)